MRMELNIKFYFYCLLLHSRYSTISTQKSPHIILIVADDLGWNDVGFHGSVQIPTPNIDSLAYSGVILNNYYVQPICTPSRGALLSGMHPIHTGLQHRNIGASHPFGLPLEYKLLPEYLNDLGYVSKSIGKWHIGYFKDSYTPLRRGFQSHYGYWTGRIDYNNRVSYGNPGWWGYDFRRDMKVERDVYGKYTTDLFSDESVKIISEHNASVPLFLYVAHLAVHSANPYDPLQAPTEIVNKFSYIKDKQRRKFAAMMWKLDESVGRLIKGLEDAQMLQNSIIVFTTDNGGPAAGFNNNAASNWPLRGVKACLWEGGIRAASFVWSPLIKNPGRVSTEMMQIMDWLPTLYRAAGGKTTDLPMIDGMDVWDSIIKENPSPRREMLHNIDPVIGSAGLRVGDWKLLIKPAAPFNNWNGWYGPSGRKVIKKPNYKLKLQLIKKSTAGRAIKKIYPGVYSRVDMLKKAAEVVCAPVPVNATRSCDDPAHPCLFHIPSDPCEYHDVSHKFPDKLKLLQSMLKAYNDTAVSPGNKPWDPNANPVNWDYTWTNWQDYFVVPAKRVNVFPIPDTKYDHIWL